MSVDSLTSALRDICGDEHLITEPDVLRTYEADGLTDQRVLPRLAVMPGSGEEVRRVVAVCHDAGVPWVARGAGTGLSGGAIPVEDALLIVLTRLRRVLEVDLDNGRIAVEPGVTNVDISAAAGPSHFYPPDPSSQIVCSIGGNVAENSGGPRCFKYGFTTNYVTGLEVVLADGSVVALGGKEVDRPGFDLTGAFVGSEGTLGIATKIWLRVVPAPEVVLTALAFFESVAAAAEVVSEIVSSGVLPAAIEMMDRLALEATSTMSEGEIPAAAEASLIVELDGPREECDARLDAVTKLLERRGALTVNVAREPDRRARIWRMRKAAFGAMGRVTPSYYVQDGVVPRTRLAEVMEEIARLSAEHGMPVANVFHAGDGNLHPLVGYDHNQPGEAERAETLAAEILRACVARGGSITGEHGIGADKKRYMPLMFDDADLETFQRLRCSFDPDGLANPGKVMPTPRLCGEVPGPYREHPLERAGVIERI